MKILTKIFPIPHFLLPSALGVDISDTSIKYMEIIFQNGNDRLGRFGEIKLEKGIIEGGKIINSEKLSSVIKFLRDKEGFKYVRATLPEEKIYQYEIELIPENVTNLRQSIELTLEEHIPLPPASVEFDFDVIEKTPKKIKVLVGAIDKATVGQYVSVFENAGITPISFELEGSALARSLIKSEDKEKAIMIVDFGGTRTGISIVYNENIAFSTTVSFGGNYLTELISKNFNISFAEAEKKKTAIGLNKAPEHKELFGIMLSGLSVLRDEINKNYIYWHTHTEKEIGPRPKIEKILLCGGNSNLTGLKEYLISSLRMNIDYADPWVNLDKRESYIPDITFEQSLSFAPSIGLALASK